MLGRNTFFIKEVAFQIMQSSFTSSGWMSRRLIYFRIRLMHINISRILVKLD